MAHAERWPGRHPLCTCPPVTFAMIDRGEPLHRGQYKGGTIAHPVITAEDIKRLVATFAERHADRDAPSGR